MSEDVTPKTNEDEEYDPAVDDYPVDRYRKCFDCGERLDRDKGEVYYISAATSVERLARWGGTVEHAARLEYHIALCKAHALERLAAAQHEGARAAEER